MIAPCAFHQLVTPKGEIATAEAAAKLQTLMIVSTMASYSLEDIAVNCNAPKWFQLYLFKDKSLTQALVRRAEAAGYDGIVVTVDVPIMGARPRDLHNKFNLPKGVQAANLLTTSAKFDESMVDGSKVKEHSDAQFDASISWETIAMLARSTHLPIILKGILNPIDAEEALKHRVHAIIVSNHGGRQLDHTISPIDALENIANIIKNKLPIYVDGGIRSGEDVFKALALGASGVMVGRPVLWSLATGGKEQLIKSFQLLNQELETTMRLCGCDSIRKIQRLGKSLIGKINHFYPPAVIAETSPPAFKLFSKL